MIDLDVDVIVNAARATLRGGCGVDGAIHAAAGPEMLAYLIENYPDPLEPGKVAISPGFALKQAWVVHAPGPRWQGGTKGEPAHLAAVYCSSMDEAANQGAESIGFCSISTGIYGCPLREAANVALTSIAGWLGDHPDSSIKKVVFAMFQQEEYDAFLMELKNRG